MRMKWIVGVGLGLLVVYAEAESMTGSQRRVAERPCWNRRAVMFLDAPTFEFETMSNGTYVIEYRSDILASDGKLYRLKTPSSRVSLTDLWEKLPTGFVSVTCRAQRPGRPDTERVVGARVFWKSAPFKGDARPRPRSFAEGARQALEHVLDAPSSRYLVDHGELDPNFSHNVYPSKMLESVIQACCALAKAVPARKDEALRLARAAADWLIANSEKEGAPLAHFPPTYRGELYAAKKNAGLVMTVYPARAALAYLALAEASGEAKYRAAAEAIAATYLRLQGEDGTWPLKMRLSDGTATSANRLVPVDSVLPLMTRLAETTGREAYRASAARAFANIRDGRLKTWNWEGQFEDVEPGAPYSNLTEYGPCDTALELLTHHADDLRSLPLARELVRFAEDQFVCWERPFVGADFKENPTVQDMDKWSFPCVLEQYSWYTPIDASAAKMIVAYLALYRAGKDPLDLAKARALGGAILRQQQPGGWIRTHWAWDETPDKIWMNCHVASALALQELAEFDGE